MCIVCCFSVYICIIRQGIFCGKSASLSFLWRIVPYTLHIDACSHIYLHILWDMWELYCKYMWVCVVYFVSTNEMHFSKNNIYFYGMRCDTQHMHLCSHPKYSQKLADRMSFVFIFEGGRSLPSSKQELYSIHERTLKFIYTCVCVCAQKWTLIMWPTPYFLVASVEQEKSAWIFNRNYCWQMRRKLRWCIIEDDENQQLSKQRITYFW